MKVLLKNRRTSTGAQTDVNALMVEYLKKAIVKQVSTKVKAEMKTQGTDEQREELYEQLVVGEYLGQRNLVMRLAREKFKKIRVKLAGIQPDRDKAESARRSESAREETEATEDPGNTTPAEKLQKLLDQIEEVKQRKDFKLKVVDLKAQPKIKGTALRLMQEREE